MKRSIALFLAIMMLSSLCACGKAKGATERSSTESTETTEHTYVNPDDYFARIELKISPEFAIYLDSSNRVVAVLALNEDALKVMGHVKADGAELSAIAKDILSSSEKNGFLKADAVINMDLKDIADLGRVEEVMKTATDAAN